MSKFRPYTLPELYNIPSPHEPGQINWKTVAVYSGIATVAALVFAACINHGNKTNLGLWVDHSERVQAAAMASIKNHDENFKIWLQALSEPKSAPENNNKSEEVLQS